MGEVRVVRRSIPVVACIVAVALLAPTVSADGSNVIIDDESSATDPGPVFAGHPASFTGVCPFVGLGHDLPQAGCMKQYTFTVPETDGGNDVDIDVEYPVTRVSSDPCVKDADLDLYLYDENGKIVAESASNAGGCDNGKIGIIEENLPSGNYVVEVRGNWGAVVEYDAHGTLEYW